MAGSFFALLNKIRSEAFSEKDKGTKFERLVRDYFRTSKRFIEQLDQVWLWNDFPFRKDFGGKDLGIDLVARTKDGSYWAIQCKCYNENTVINKAAVDTFISTSGRTFKNEAGATTKFSYRVWVATTESWGANARETLENQDIPCNILNGFDIDNDPTVDWDKIEQGMYGTSASVKEQREVKNHQKIALENAHEYYKTHDRGQLIMACGTGKTFTALRLVEQETKNKGLILVLVPSIALINQTLNEWNSYSTKPIYPICVCSDSTASRRKVTEADDLTDTPVDLAMPACTDVKSIARQLSNAMDKAEGMVVVYSTYQSIDVISEAQKYLSGKKKDAQAELFDDGLNHDRDYTFDFIVCDEAHRTTGATLSGKDESHFVKVHSNENINARRRLYMTATPRLYEENTKKKAEQNSVVLCSMDDESLYGKEFYRIGFGEAVEKGLLADYKVLILTVRDNTPMPVSVMDSIQDKDKEINTDDAVKLVGCISALSKRVDPPSDDVKAIDPGLMHKAVAFCSRISNSKSIAASYNEYAKQVSEYYAEGEDDTVVISAKHIDGGMSAGERNKLVAWLKDAPTSGTECRVLTNVRCLSEGVDVPSLDAVIFLSARNSQVDVVQSVGRVMRTAPGKKYGYIIIPIVVPAGGDANAILDDNERFKVVWTVLNALRAHDDRFNAWVNKLELNERKPKDGGSVVVGPGASKPHGGFGIGEPGGTGTRDIPQQLLLFDENIRDALYAKMVLKVGTKRYWEQWANDVAAIALRHKERINRLIQENENYRTAFDMYMDGLHKNINPNIDEETAKDMLSQHMVTKPVFDALFGNSSFTESNPISLAMKRLLELVDETAYEKDQEVMKNFYKSVQDRCEGIDNASGKQKIIIELYDKFFKKALSKTVEKLGIVYTPVEIVDFINQSVADVLKKEFGRKIGDENVHIIDPFTGTGTFITRMIQSGLIEHKDLPRKYEKELHANEIVLLAYYIASVNIENAYHDAMGQDAETYTPFNGICLTDTFQLYEDQDNDVERLKFADVFPQNSKRVIRQSKIPVQVIVGNPPYSAKQKNANDNAQNDSYPKLEKRIANTYAAGTKATNKNALYDSYIKAFRWASDRLDNKAGGVIGFVTNAGWIDGSAMDGMRKCFEEEFDSIYIYNLKGAIRGKIGDNAKKEGQNVFNIMTGVAVVVLVKKPRAVHKKATIYYREVDDYLTRDNKLAAVVKTKSTANSKFTQKILKPNDNGDWLNQRSDIFSTLIVIADKKNKELKETFFSPNYSSGLKTQRDAWCYNCSAKKLADNIKRSINFYNEQVKRVAKGTVNDIVIDSKKFSWSDATLNDVSKGQAYKFDDGVIVESVYKPFNKSNVFYYKPLNERQYQLPKLFPTPETKNLLICVSGVGGLSFAVIITNKVTDITVVKTGNGGTQCFPLYWYEEKKDEANIGLFDALNDNNGPEYIRHDGITDYILKAARDQYKTNAISKEDIFYYVYGILHSEDYRTQFAADLKKMLPRLPLVDSAADFKAFSTAGRKLADLHLNYENRPAPAGVIVDGDTGSNYHVIKMKFPSKDNTSEIIYNSQITIKNIPPEAYEYIVNGRTAIGWIMERYQIKTDKDSGIVNDPNDWAIEHGKPRYILDLLLSIITVSIETMKIVKGLPKLKF